MPGRSSGLRISFGRAPISDIASDVLLEVALKSEYADLHLGAPLRLAEAPLVTSPGPPSSGREWPPRVPASPGRGPWLTLATICASSWWVVASTMARALRAGSSLLKIPEPTNTASAPSCITSAASAGVAMPPAQKSGTGRWPVSATSVTRSIGAASRFAHP